MGINVEFNPDLALRAFGTEGRLEAECLPRKLEEGRVYSFLKKGQRDYWFGGQIPLLETKGNEKLSRPLAAIRIIEATHFWDSEKKEVYTRGFYGVVSVFDSNSEKINFESYKRI